MNTLVLEMSSILWTINVTKPDGAVQQFLPIARSCKGFAAWLVGHSLLQPLLA